MRRFRYVAAFAALAILGCSRDADQSPHAIDVELWQDEMPIRQPWLRENLPDQSLVYARVPHVLGLFATPKGNVLDTGLRSKVNVENVQKIQQGLIDNVFSVVPLLSEPELRLVQTHVRSPIELSATFLPAPASLIAATLDIDSNAAFDAVLEELGVALTAPLDAQNIGQIGGAPMPLLLQFDAGSGRLLINTGPSVTAESFGNLIAAMNRDEPHRMRALESRIDTSGQGFFLWVDAQEAIPMMQMFVPREQFDELMELGFRKVDAVALGWGVANGKGRISLAADIPTGDDRGFIPYVNNDLSAHSVGDPDALMVASIPTVEEFRRLEALAIAKMPAAAADEWSEGKQLVQEVTGVTLEEMLAAVGPEILVIFDRAGDYVAIRLRDPDLWDSVLERIAAATGSSPETRKVAGNTYYHWSIPSAIDQLDDKVRADLPWFGELWARQRDHLYWMRDGDFLYTASVPQILFDRVAMQPETNIGQWLSQRQRIDAEHAALSISGSSRKLPGRLYAIYIELLQILADIGQTDIDVWSMPSAAQLDLPELGTVGFTVSLGNPTLAAEFTFENNPAELFGSLGAVAAVGVIAAIAIPAYQDYSIRAQVSTGLNLSAAAKAQITEYYSSNGRFPGAADAERMSIPENAGPFVWSVTVEPDTGVIMIEYEEFVATTGGQLFLEPSVEESGQISWNCWSTLSDKHIPAACRQ
ncbi:MAG: pilin [Gammaproteobacteria bacterium]|nr:pilin [Gammaproteobacteria bacterium]